jgi:hypothetical protein
MKLIEDKIFLVKIKKVEGMLYLPRGSFKIKKAVIHAKGGPSLGDEGNSPLWEVAKKHQWALFVPDYIGYCRSAGTFSFRNCVYTLYEAEDFLRGCKKGIIVETGKTIQLKCEEILLIGSSWGGAIVPFLEKYKHSKIKVVGLIKPVLDWKSQGRTNFPEEDVIKTNRSIVRGWLNIYRGYKKSEWPAIFKKGLREYNPLDNLHLLKEKIIFLCHGEKDEVVNWRKSYSFYQALKRKYPKIKIFWKLFKNQDHSSKMTAVGLGYILKKLSSKGKKTQKMRNIAAAEDEKHRLHSYIKLYQGVKR